MTTAALDELLPIERGHVKSLRNAGDAPFAVLAVLVLDAGQPPLLPALPAIAAALRPPEEHSGG
ncbi:MAG TPA: hypothetical protein VNP92_23110 [Actinophytocola sp.]|nr:hypothetical protein [Actinophytocola sp.]